MVENAYRFLLQLYPPEHQALFGKEMRRTFEETLRRDRQGTFRKILLFALSELSGLVRGSLTEWLLNWSRGSAYLRNESNLILSTDVPQIEQQLQTLVSRMELAIAHHDFPGARRWSDQERITRAHLRHILRAQAHPTS